MGDIKFFKMPDGMKPSFTCIFCDKGDCEVLIQINEPGGNNGGAHQTCLDAYMADENQEAVEE